MAAIMSSGIIRGLASSHAAAAQPASKLRCQQGCRAATPSMEAPAASASRYAILDVGGVRQVVEEGEAYVQPSALCPPPLQRTPGGKPKLHFSKVVAMRDNGRFSWGQPYMPGVLVEAELLEEFCGPIPVLEGTAAEAGTASGITPNAMMSKYLVTRITQHSS